MIPTIYSNKYKGCPFKDRCEKVGKGRDKYGWQIKCREGDNWVECVEVQDNKKKFGCEHKDKCIKFAKPDFVGMKYLCYQNYEEYKKCSEYETYCKQGGCEYRNRCKKYLTSYKWATADYCHIAHFYKNCKYREKNAKREMRQKAVMPKRIIKGVILIVTALAISIILELIGIV